MTRPRWFHPSLLPLLALLATSLAAAEPLPSDDRVKTGTLENGVKWIFRHNATPPERMNLLVHVDSGSLNETDEQRGLAHFLEHMAFNGTENFKPGDLIPYFESIGMEFGPDLNAFTGLDQTAYLLILPDNKTETVDKGLLVLSDYVFRQTLTPEELDKERGVILAEKRAGMSAQQRLRDKLFEQLFEGTRVAKRLPIGIDEVIEKAPREQFEKYYRTWYRPELMTVIMVGDGKLEDYLPALQKQFGQYKAPLDAQKPLGAEFKPFTKTRAIVLSDPEVGEGNVDLYNLRPARPPVTTVERARQRLVEELGSRLIGRRFSEQIKEGRAKFIDANAGVSNVFNEAFLANVSASGEPGDWKIMLEQVVAEVQRVQQHGFLPQEFELIRKEIVAAAEREVRTEPTRDSQGLLFQLNSYVNSGDTVMSAQQRLDLLNRILPEITLEEVQKTFKENFAPGTWAYVLTLPEKDGQTLPTSEEVVAAATSAEARPTEAWVWRDRPTTILEKAPTPGRIAESTTDADLGVTSAWLENGVRVHHRFMDYRKDTVLMSISLIGGQIEETAENAGVTTVATLAFDRPATGRLRSTDVEDLMTGKNIRVSATGQGDLFSISVTGSPIDLETGLELVHALLTDGRIEQTAFDQWKERAHQEWENVSRVPGFQATVALRSLTSGGDPRLAPMSPERIDRQTLEAGQAWFERLRREAPIEVAIVGDIQADVALPLVEKYLGSLPKRERTAAALDKLRTLNRGAGPLERTVEVDTITPQTVVFAGFMGTEVQNVADVRALNLAALTLDSRLVKRIREELALVYGIGANSVPAETYRDSGIFLSGAPCAPGKGGDVIREVEAIFAAFTKDGPTAEELENAKKQVTNNVEKESREPGFWMNLLRTLTLRGLKLDEYKDITAKYQAYTAEQVRETFAKYNTQARMFRVMANPKAGVEEPAAGNDKPSGANGG